MGGYFPIFSQISRNLLAILVGFFASLLFYMDNIMAGELRIFFKVETWQKWGWRVRNLINRFGAKTASF